MCVIDFCDSTYEGSTIRCPGFEGTDAEWREEFSLLARECGRAAHRRPWLPLSLFVDQTRLNGSGGSVEGISLNHFQRLANET